MKLLLVLFFLVISPLTHAQAPALDCDATKFHNGYSAIFSWQGILLKGEPRNGKHLEFMPMTGTRGKVLFVTISLKTLTDFQASIEELVNQYHFDPSCVDERGDSIRAYLHNRPEMLEFVSPYFKKRDLESAQTAEREAQIRKRQEEDRTRKVAAFRKALQEGDETTSGIVIQVKGNLVKIQTNDTQCSQRNYDGVCANYINTPVEKWVKRSEIYPK